MAYRVYVGNISRRCYERDLEHFFRPYHVDRVELVGTTNPFAFLEFRYRRDADDAIRDNHDYDFQGRRLVVEYAKSRPPRERRSTQRNSRPDPRHDLRIVVEGVSSRTTWQSLKDWARQEGAVQYADVMINKDGHRDGIVEFQSRSDFKRALKHLDEHKLDDRRIHVRPEIETDTNSRSRSLDRKRSTSKSRSRSQASRSRSRSHDSRSRSRSSHGSRSRSNTSRSRSRSRSHSREKKEETRDRSASPSLNDRSPTPTWSQSPHSGRDTPDDSNEQPIVEEELHSPHSSHDDHEEES